MVLMSAGKSARHQAMISNNTQIYGSMGGLASFIGTPLVNRSHLIHNATTNMVIPPGPTAGMLYMQQNGLIQRNPAFSGGVGRRTLMFR
jgi:hypothetical protein